MNARRANCWLLLCAAGVASGPLVAALPTTAHHAVLQQTQEAADGEDFLPNWMGKLGGVIGDHTLLDLALPGTHDTMTYDLSTTVSNGGEDNEWIALLLRTLNDDIPSKWIREQAQTQGLNITAQLDTGIRFLDFRVMWTWPLDNLANNHSNSTDDPFQWRCLHFMQSQHSATDYLRQVRAWMDAHPTEIVVLWTSKHGNEEATGEDQYPSVSQANKRQFFNDIVEIFDGVMFDSRASQLNTTTISQLLERSHRLVYFAADYAEFTDNSPLALDSRLVHNEHDESGITNLTDGQAWQRSQFRDASKTKAADKAQGKFFLLSLAGGSPTAQLEASFALTHEPFGHESLEALCSDAFHIQNVTRWCPLTLMDISLATNFYCQRVIDEVVQNFDEGFEFPNAIYIDTVDYNGTIRTGTQRLNPLEEGVRTVEGNDDRATTKFAYVDTMLLSMTKVLCKGAPDDKKRACDSAVTLLEARRAVFPVQRWDDFSNGRVANWP